MAQNQGTDWHLEKKITLTLIWSIILIITGGVFAASKIIFKLQLLEERTASNRMVIERLVRVETQLESVQSSQVRIEKALAAKEDKQ